MENFSLNLIDIEVKRIQMSEKLTKLINISDEFIKFEIKKSFLVFLYNFFIDSVAKGNKSNYINDEVIYYDKDRKVFLYHSKFY